MIWRFIYRLLTAAAVPLVFGYFRLRARREPAYARHWRERLGHHRDLPLKPIWLHAASVGEVNLIAPLVEELASLYPDSHFLITTMTPAGRARAHALFADNVRCCYLPLDTVAATRRFFRNVAPRIGVVTETELWPNLSAAATQARVPLVYINGIISERSAERYARRPAAWAVRDVLAQAAEIGVVNELQARRFLTLGAAAGAVRITGNLKYDVGDQKRRFVEGAALREQWQAEDRFIWTVASTHDGEEAIVLKAFAVIRRRRNALLVIAPRHPQRFDSVADLLAATTWRVSRRSKGEPVGRATDIVLADTLGEVPNLYAAADVVSVGGSFVPGIGGHNVIEAAALGRPVVIGSHATEWRDATQALVRSGGARIVEDQAELAEAVGVYFADQTRAGEAGQAAREFVAAGSGALFRSIAMIRAHLPD